MTCKRLLPAEHCVICEKSLEEIGGRRIVAQQVRGVFLSEKYLGGGDPDYPYQSFRMPGSSLYLLVWGSRSMWSEDAVQRAINVFQRNKRPWFCQDCGNRICPECSFPVQYPVGSDVLYDDGCSTHIGMLPICPGCINPNCPTQKKENG